MSARATVCLRKRSRILVRAALAAGALSCSGSRPYEPIPSPPDPETRATLAGPLCSGSACQCADEAHGAGQPDEGAKRFEIRLGPSSHELWATVDDMVLYKTGQHATDCYYVDLHPGDHHVVIRAKHEDFVGFEAHIAEQGGGEEAPLWYRTLDFHCGGQCTADQLAEFKKYATGAEGKLDPCGSTRVKQITWETGRMPDQVHPDDVLLDMTLDVYEFTPKKAPCPAE